MVASWLVHLSRERVVRVRILVKDIVLCSWARHFTLTVPSIQTDLDKQYTANVILGVKPCNGLKYPIKGEVEMLYSKLLHATETGTSSSLIGQLQSKQVKRSSHKWI